MPAQKVHHYPVTGGAIAYAWSHGAVSHPLVMLHGLGDSAILTFRDRISQGALAATPILLIDLPGFGESAYSAEHPATIDRYADDVADLLRNLRVNSVTIFGHSMGGNVAMALAHRHPECVGRLILAEPLLHTGQSVLASEIARHQESTFVEQRYSMLLRATSMQANRGDVTATAFLEPLRRANPTAMHRAARSLLAGAAPGFGRLLVQTSLPRTFIVGSNTVTDTSAIEMANIPIIRIPNSGHFMLVEQEFATTYAILEAMT